MKVEVDILGSPSLIVHTVSMDVSKLVFYSMDVSKLVFYSMDVSKLVFYSMDVSK